MFEGQDRCLGIVAGVRRGIFLIVNIFIDFQC